MGSNAILEVIGGIRLSRLERALVEGNLRDFTFKKGVDHHAVQDELEFRNWESPVPE